MNLGSLEKEYASIASNYSQAEQMTPTLNYPNLKQQNLPGYDFNRKDFKPSFDRSSLKNLSNEDLDRLIQMKNKNLEKYPASNQFNPPQNDQPRNSLTSSGHKISNSNVSQILNKYNLGGSEGERGIEKKTNEPKVNDSNFFSNLETVPVTSHGLPTLNPAFTNTGFDSLKRNIENAAKQRINSGEPLKENPFHMNALENPYLSNLESSVDRNDYDPKNNVTKENDSLSFNQDYVLGKEPQMTPSVYESSPLRSSGARQQNKENILKNLSRLQVTPKGLPKPLRNDGGSPAIAGAMKALQDRLGNAESEAEEMRRKLGDITIEKQRELEEQRRKMYKELDEKNEKEAELRKALESEKSQNFQHQSEINRLKMTNQSNEEQLQKLRNELAHIREEMKSVQQENTVVKKEVSLIENEKNFHLEQNANDRDDYEVRIEELTAQLEAEREKCDELEKHKEEANIIRVEIENELRRVTNKATELEKQMKERVKTLEHRLEEAQKQSQSYYEEFTVSNQKHEKDRNSLQKKLNEAERRMEAIVMSYEEKIEILREENKDLKKGFNAQNSELVALRKRDIQLEKTNTKLETDRTEREKAIRQLIELNDELVRKMKKDPNNAALQNLLFKKKKIEQDLQSRKASVGPVAKTTDRSVRKKAISRSPSVTKSSRKDRLSMEDLSFTHEDARSELLGSVGKKKSARSGSNRLTSPSSSSRMITPSKELSSSQNKPKKSTRSKSKSKKDKPLEISQGEYSSKNPPLGFLSSPTEDTPSAYTGTGKFGIPATFSSDSTKKLLTSISSNDYLTTSKNAVETPQTISNPPIKLGIDVEKMTSGEISTEIVKVEREISELKREYKNLLAKVQNPNTENLPEVKTRLNEAANDLQEKSEIHLLLKKKQRELLSKNL